MNIAVIAVLLLSDEFFAGVVITFYGAFRTACIYHHLCFTIPFLSWNAFVDIPTSNQKDQDSSRRLLEEAKFSAKVAA
jgi:hypothetical protein